VRESTSCVVEEGVLSKAKAIEAIETVAELTREMADGNPPSKPTSPRTSSERSRRASH